MTSASTLKSIRLTHHYIGVFFAPTILFFALTGGLQMFGLHETSRGSSYVPPALLVHLSQLHKKGTLYVSPHKPASLSVAGTERQKTDTGRPDVSKVPAQPPPAPAHNALPMKIFFAATAIALVLSTCTGLFMAWKYSRRKSVFFAVLSAGVVCPVLLLFL